MHRLVAFTFGLVVLSGPISCNAFTVTFDEIPAGGNLWYYLDDANQLYIANSFVVADHSTSTWGLPHSGKNVLTVSSFQYPLRIDLMAHPLDTSTGGTRYNATYFGTYFSTFSGVVMKMTLFRQDGSPIVDTAIGSQSSAWNNQLVEYYSSAGDINSVKFDILYLPPHSISGLFCLDDLTVIPVPEPSSILALLTGLAGIGGFALNRRKI